MWDGWTMASPHAGASVWDGWTMVSPAGHVHGMGWTSPAFNISAMPHTIPHCAILLMPPYRTMPHCTVLYDVIRNIIAYHTISFMALSGRTVD